MKSFQKMGGIAALYAGAAYVVGMLGFLLVVNISEVVDPIPESSSNGRQSVFLSLLHLIVYQIWAIFLVVLTLALYEQLKADAPAICRQQPLSG